MPFAPLSPPLHNAVCRASVEFWHDKASPVLCVSILVPASLSPAAIGHFPFFHPARRCYSTRARSHTHTRARAGHARFLRNVISTRSFAYYISCKYIYIYISILYANISRTQPWLEFLIIIRFFNCSNFNSNFRLPSDTLSLRLSLSAETTNLRARVSRANFVSISDYNNNNNNNNSNDKSVLKSGRRKRCFLRGVHEFPLDFFAAYIS